MEEQVFGDLCYMCKKDWESTKSPIISFSHLYSMVFSLWEDAMVDACFCGGIFGNLEGGKNS